MFDAATASTSRCFAFFSTRSFAAEISRSRLALRRFTNYEERLLYIFVCCWKLENFSILLFLLLIFYLLLSLKSLDPRMEFEDSIFLQVNERTTKITKFRRKRRRKEDRGNLAREELSDQMTSDLSCKEDSLNTRLINALSFPPPSGIVKRATFLANR